MCSLVSGVQTCALPIFLAVAGELVEAGAGPDVRRYPKILVEQFGGGDDLAQDGARAHQLDAVPALLGLAGVLEQVHALDDPLGAAPGHGRVAVFLVRQGVVPVLGLLFADPSLLAVLYHRTHFSAYGRVCASQVRVPSRLSAAVAT